MTKKILSVLVSLALILALVPAVAMADGGGSQAYPGPWYSIDTDWNAGGTVVLIDEDDNVFAENGQPNAGESFVFQANPDPGYKFTGWSYYQELYTGTHDGWFCRDRVYRASGNTIEVHLNPVLLKIRKVEKIIPNEVLYRYSTMNISDAEYNALEAIPRINTLDFENEAIHNKHITASFEAIEYTVVFHEDGGNTSVGTLYGDGTVTLADLHTGSDTATAFFNGWSLTSGGSDLVTEVALDGTGADTVVDVYANYILRQQYIVSATVDGAGSLTDPSSILFLEGNSVTYDEVNNHFQPVADPDVAPAGVDGGADNEFVGWFFENGDEFTAASPALTAGTALIARFSTTQLPPEVVTIAAVAEGPGTLSTSLVLEVPYGSTVSEADLNTFFNPTPDPDTATQDNFFDGWYYENGDPYDFTAPVTNSLDLTAKFGSETIEPEMITISATAGTGGSVAPASAQSEAGVQVDLDSLFTPTADTGYAFAGWTDAQGNAIADGLVTPQTDIAVIATFEAQQTEPEMITISATAGTGGSVAPASAQSEAGVQVDLDSLFTPTADTGYTFAGWTDAQGNAIADGLVTPQADIAVIATFAVQQTEPEMVTITAVAGLGGSVTPATKQVEKGSQVDLDTLFTVTPDTGNSFAKWVDAANAEIVDGVMTANSDVTVNAVFATTIDDDDTPTGDVDDTDDSDNPHTGTQSMLWIAFILFAVAGAGAVAMSRAREARRMRR